MIGSILPQANLRVVVCGLLCGICSLLAQAGEYTPYVAPASKEASQAMARFALPDGFQVELVAAEPLLANPVAFCIDERGVFYVAESFRVNDGVPDNRWFMRWLEDDLASRTVEDRLAMYRKHLTTELERWAIESDRVRRIVDVDGDGTADHSTVFADGFSRLEDGIAAGVLARDGDVWFTCIPHLWFLRDTDGDGRADVKKSLQNGYGVHVAFFGHDLHGLAFGPDGKLYFSVGDRGLHVTTNEGVVSAPDCGSVLRCNPDGTELEIFATGLRNPQELAFDEYGNLFTGDNNSDSGDRARIVYVVEGGDSGWRMPYQYLESPYPRGPWNEDKLWLPAFEGQAAYIVPPIANFADGPSGLAYNPGLGLPPEYDRNFFLVDFRGSSMISGVRRFRLEPQGAGFRLASSDTFLWRVVATDIDFGYDGAVYLLDWVDGWSKTGKGRIYRLYHPESRSAGAAVAKVMAQDFDTLRENQLESLLSHGDKRVRQRAQFTLAKRPAEGFEVFARVAADAENSLARLHAIWGIGQIGRVDRDRLSVLRTLMTDSDAEVRAQAARTAGDLKYAGAYDSLIRLLDDDSARVRMLAAIAVGRLAKPEATAALLTMLAENANSDPFVRHGGVMGLVGSKDVDAVLAAGRSDQPEPVQIAALLTMRHWKSPKLAMFFERSKGFSTSLVEEAARAVYDQQITEAFPELAKLVYQKELPVSVRRRALYTCYRLGDSESVQAIGSVAADDDEKERFRIEALTMLKAWAEPARLDGITGSYWPIANRTAEPAQTEFSKRAAGIIGSRTAPISELAIEIAGMYRVDIVTDQLIEIFRDETLPATTRSASLRALAEIGTPKLGSLIQNGLSSKESLVRSESQSVLAKVDPAAAVSLLANTLGSGDIGEQQRALATLGDLDTPEADVVLSRWLDRLHANELAPEIRLDLRMAASKRESPEVRTKLDEYEKSLAAEGPTGRYKDTLVGGNPDRGKDIVFEKTEVACLRCHKFLGRGGEVGPDLTRVAAKKDRQYLLESIVEPNRAVADGFDTSILLLADGSIKTGVVRSETDSELILYDADGKQWVVPKSEIDERQRGKSAMPDDLVQKLTEAELRDLIAFLATRK